MNKIYMYVYIYIYVYTDIYLFLFIYSDLQGFGFGLWGFRATVDGAMFVVARGFCLKGSCEGLYKP